VASSRREPADSPSFVVLGLGNPGEEYARTRHNFGVFVVDALAQESRASFRRGPGPVRGAIAQMGGELVVLAKPTTYMNRSGDAALALRASFPEIPLSRWLVVADDLDLPFGKLRVRAEGGAGGHNGLRSLMDALGGGEFPRLRLGIGRPLETSREDVVDWVLEPFEEEEWTHVPAIVSAAAEGVRIFVREGVAAAMNRTNAHAPLGPKPPGGDA
jgi:PTH1 family peptidyl-tRNA hydrolase